MSSKFPRACFVVVPFIALFVAGCGDDASDSTPGADDAADGSTSDVLGSDGPASDTSASDSAATDTKPGDGSALDSAVSDGATDGDAKDAVADVPPARGPAPVSLGLAGTYVMLGESELKSIPTSVITGDLGLSPAAASFITGFSMTRAGTYWTASQVTGKIYAADNDPPTPTLVGTAITNMETAYTDAATRPTPDVLNLLGGAIAGSTLTPGLYRWTSAVTMASDITISGNANDTWIFQITGDLVTSSSAKVKLAGGARAKNIVWQVAGLVDVGTTSHLEGVVLCKTGITLKTGASINGRLLAQTAIIVDTSTVTQPSP